MSANLARVFLNSMKSNNGQLFVPSIYSNRFNVANVELSAMEAQKCYRNNTTPIIDNGAIKVMNDKICIKLPKSKNNN